MTRGGCVAEEGEVGASEVDPAEACGPADDGGRGDGSEAGYDSDQESQYEDGHQVLPVKSLQFRGVAALHRIDAPENRTDAYRFIYGCECDAVLTACRLLAVFVIRATRGFAEGDELGVEELGGEGAGEGFDGGVLLGGEVGEAFCGAGELGFADGFGVLLEGEDGGDGVAGLEALLVLVYFVC